MSFHRETHIKKTRKAKKCDWCAEPIEIGAEAVHVTGRGDWGDFYSMDYHPECNAAIDRYCADFGQDDYLPDCPMNRGGVMERGEPEPE